MAHSEKPDVIADHILDAFALSLGEALSYNSALEYAAKWVEYSANGDTNLAVVQFAANMAMSLRAAKVPVQQEDFFDAVRNDPEMTPEQKAYWLAFEQETKQGQLTSSTCLNGVHSKGGGLGH